MISMTMMGCAVSIVAVILSGLSFAAFWFFASRPKEASDAAEGVIKKAAAANTFTEVVDISKLLESAAKLVESLSKAGPSLAALGASVLFLSIAAYVSMPIKSDTTKPAAADTSKQSVKQ